MKVTSVSAPNAAASHPTANPAIEASKSKAIEMLSRLNKGGSQPVAAAEQHQAASFETAPPDHVAMPIPNLQAEPSTPVQAETPPEAPKNDKLLEEYNTLVRKEKMQRQRVLQQEQAFKTKEAELEKRAQELATKEAQYAQDYIPKARLKSNTLDVLAEADLSYDDLTQQLIQQSSTPVDPRLQAHIQKLEAQLQALTKGQEESAQRQKDAQAEQYKAALGQIKSDATELVNADPEFEAIKATNSIQDVVDLIEAVFKDSKGTKLMTVAEAAKEVEKELTEQLFRYTKINKIKSKLIPASAVPVQAAPAVSQTPAETVPKQPQPMKTLTNASSSMRQLSARERALLVFKGEMKHHS